jgi:predicted HTH domain antitoxin
MKIIIEIPDQFLLDRDPEELAKHIKLNAALRMFQSHELSVGAAVELAGVDRFTFALECQKRGIAVVDYPVEDLRAELESFRNAS